MDHQKLYPQISIYGLKKQKNVSPRKQKFAEKLKNLLREYDTCLIVTIDNVKSSQIDNLKKQFRGRARFLFGKNTLTRRIIRDYMKETDNRNLLSLLDLVKGNSGFIFTKHDISELCKEIKQNKVECYAKAGSIAPIDVYIPSGKTGIEPTQTSLFQMMNISTRIQNNQITVLKERKIINKNEKVGINESLLLKKLNIKPFYYGIKVDGVYCNGDYHPNRTYIDITEEDISQSFYVGLKRIAGFCGSINYPTIINVPFDVINSYKKVLSLGLSFKKYKWKNLEIVKDNIENLNNNNQMFNNSDYEETPDPPSSDDGPNIFDDDSESSYESEE